MRISALIALFITIYGVGAGPSRGGLILGVLEDVSPADEGQANVRIVRIVFKKSGADWVPYDTCNDEQCLKSVSAKYPQEVNWTIAFDGKALGQVTARTPHTFPMYWRIGQQEITSAGTVPTIGTPSAEFGGFLDANVYRPLVAISQPQFKDPEMWKPGQVSLAALVALRGGFRRHYPRLCRTSPADETKLAPYPYKDAEIKLVKTYTAGTGWSVVRLHLEAIDCDDVEAGLGMDDPWFAVDPQGTVRYLDAGMWLVDAGDYDNDGKSELLFSINQHNLGGYKIFYDNFNKHAEFTFRYH